MDLERSLASTLLGHDDSVAIACIDAQTGMLIASAIRGPKDAALDEALSSCTSCIDEIMATPAIGEGREGRSEETLVVGAHWMQVVVRASARPELVILGVAPPSGNLGLLLSTARSVASSLGT